MLVRQFGLHPCTMCTLHAETSRLLATEEADTEDRLQDKISYVWCQEKVGWWGSQYLTSVSYKVIIAHAQGYGAVSNGCSRCENFEKQIASMERELEELRRREEATVQVSQVQC